MFECCEPRYAQYHRADPLYHDLCKVKPLPRLDWFGDHGAISRVWMYGEEVVHLDDLGLSCEGKEQCRCRRYACRRLEGVDPDVQRYVGYNGNCDEQAEIEVSVVSS